MAPSTDPVRRRDPPTSDDLLSDEVAGVDALADDFAQRLRRGDQPSIEQYAADHPKFATEIRELFPTIEALENARRKKHDREPMAAAGGRLEQLGDFRIIREIGRGGMGVVYEAEQESLGRRVAVKVLPRQFLLDEKAQQRFSREAKTAASLHHTNIVPVLGVGQCDGYHYYVMQFIDGRGLDEIIDSIQLAMSRRGSDSMPRSLRECLKAPGRSRRSAETQRISLTAPEVKDPTEPDLPPTSPFSGRTGYWRDLARLAWQVASALAHAHEHGALHRDIKPSNLILDREGTLWVADFGLAKSIGQEQVSQTGDIVGTLRYMAPEQFRGLADARSDVYSLGLTLFELLALEPAYNESTRHRLNSNGELAGDPPSPRSLNPSIPRDLETIVLKATAADPDHRYATAGDLADDLMRYIEDRPLVARRAGPIERAWRWSRRNPALAALSVVAIASLALVAVTSSVAYVHTKDALARESEQRQKAEATLGVSLATLDRVYQRFAADRSLDGATFSGSGLGNSAGGQPALSKEAAEMLKELLAVYDQLVEVDDKEALRMEAAVANRRLGDVYQRLARSKEAQVAYSEAIRRYRAIGADDPEVAVEVARIRVEMGNVFRLANEEDAAERDYHIALKSLEEQSTQRSTPRLRYEMARVHYLLGLRRDGQGTAEDAISPSDRSKTSSDLFPPWDEKGERRPDEPPGGGPRFGPPDGRGPPGGYGPPDGFGPPDGRGPPDRGPLGRGDRPGGRGHGKEGRPPRNMEGFSGPREFWPPLQAPPVLPPEKPRDPEAMRNMKLAIELLIPLTKEQPAVPEYRRLLALCYREQANDRDIRIPQDSTAILEQLVAEHPRVADYRYDLADLYAMFDVRGLATADYAAAEKRLRAALAQADKLDPNVPAYLVARIQIAHKLCLVLRLKAAHSGDRRIDLQEPIALCLKAVDQQSWLVDEFPDVVAYRAWRSRLQRTLAELHLDRQSPGDRQESIDRLKIAAVDLESLIGAPLDQRAVLQTLADIEELRSHLLDHAGDQPGSEAARSRSREHRQQAEEIMKKDKKNQ